MRYHLKNKATHWTGDGDLQLAWCVVDENGTQLSRWGSYKFAEFMHGKLIARRGRVSA